MILFFLGVLLLAFAVVIVALYLFHAHQHHSPLRWHVVAVGVSYLGLLARDLGMLPATPGLALVVYLIGLVGMALLLRRVVLQA